MRRHAPHRTPLKVASLLLLLAASFLAGCSPGGATTDDARRVLRFAYLPSEEDPEGRVDATHDLADRLARYTGLEVEIIRAVSYAPTIEAMRAGKIDVIRAGGPFTYMIAHEKAGAEAIVAFGTSDGRGIYKSLIVASRESGLEHLDDLTRRAAELDFAFVNPASTSGHLIPRAALESRGLDPDSDFAELIYTMNHTNSAMTIVSGKVDAGALSLSSYERLLRTGKLEADDLVILWESDPIPTGPVMVHPDLPEDVKQGIRQAYLSLNTRDDPLYEQMALTYRKEDLTFYEASDADWDDLRSIAQSVRTMTMLPGR